jgi:hypothetical protein
MLRSQQIHHPILVNRPHTTPGTRPGTPGNTRNSASMENYPALTIPGLVFLNPNTGNLNDRGLDEPAVNFVFFPARAN